jgi:expansin (peptidoglycan-binding protein)
VDAFAKTANGSARTLAKLISSVNKIMALNGIKTPDAEAAAAAAGETLKMNGFLYRTAVWINDFGERAGISALVCIPRE